MKSISKENLRKITNIYVLCIFSIEGEYVPMPGDEVQYRLCIIPPKFEKHQAVHCMIINLTPEKHKKWEEPCNEKGHTGY